MTDRPTFPIVGGVIKWLGLSGLVTGGLGSGYAMVTALQTRTGWGLSPLERCCMRGTLNKAALALLLGSMFFVLAGAGMVLISRPLLRLRKSPKGIRWPRYLARSLYVYSACSVALGVILAVELQDRVASGGALVGLVIYCILVGVGLLIASWGLTRFAESV